MMKEKGVCAESLDDHVLHRALLHVQAEEEQSLEEEMKSAKPYVFSADFERKMEELMTVETSEMKVEKRKKKLLGRVRYAAVAMVIVLLGDVLFSENKSMVASNMKFGITQWLEHAFVVEEGIDVRQDEGVLFQKNQIGYLPSGFRLVLENVGFAKVYLQFENDKDDYIVLKVERSKASLGIDNEQIEQEIYISELGLEYQFIISKELEVNGILWSDLKGQIYILTGTVPKNEIIKIMNNIIYGDE